MSELNNTDEYYSKIEKITKQLKFLQEETSDTNLEPDFIQQEYSKIRNELLKITQVIEKEKGMKVPDPQQIKIKLSELPETEKGTAMELFHIK